MRSGLAPDRAWRIEHGLVNGQQFRGVEQFVRDFEQLLEFEFLQLLEFLEFFRFLELVEFRGLVLQFRRIQFRFERFVLRLGFVRWFRTEYEALGVG